MKRLLLVLMLILGAVMITSRPVATYAYTDEEKQQAKSWLSSHGYPPTRAGAEQAYQDYMDGKIDVPQKQKKINNLKIPIKIVQQNKKIHLQNRQTTVQHLQKNQQHKEQQKQQRPK